MAAASSGNGNNGTIADSSDVSWTAGQANGALSFDGNDDYVRVPVSAGSSLDLNSGPITLTAWVKTNAIGADQAILLRGLATGPGHQCWKRNSCD
jgi:hypothetical protein